MNDENYTWKHWSNADEWDEIYLKDIDDDLSKYRTPEYLIRGILAISKNEPLKILDAGTGVSLLPEVASFMGHQVLAIDISQVAIKECKERKTTNDDIKECFGYMYNRRKNRHQTVFEFIEKRTRNIIDLDKEFLKYSRSEGKIIDHVVLNWNNPILKEKYGAFDLILHQNGLKGASAEIIEETFCSFINMLKPGGIIVESNINAIMRIEIIEMFAQKAGFNIIDEGKIGFDFNNYEKLKLSPTEKHILLCWPTG